MMKKQYVMQPCEIYLYTLLPGCKRAQKTNPWVIADCCWGELFQNYFSTCCIKSYPISPRKVEIFKKSSTQRPSLSGGGGTKTVRGLFMQDEVKLPSRPKHQQKQQQQVGTSSSRGHLSVHTTGVCSEEGDTETLPAFHRHRCPLYLLWRGCF